MSSKEELQQCMWSEKRIFAMTDHWITIDGFMFSLKVEV